MTKENNTINKALPVDQRLNSAHVSRIKKLYRDHILARREDYNELTSGYFFHLMKVTDESPLYKELPNLDQSLKTICTTNTMLVDKRLYNQPTNDTKYVVEQTWDDGFTLLTEDYVQERFTTLMLEQDSTKQTLLSQYLTPEELNNNDLINHFFNHTANLIGLSFFEDVVADLKKGLYKKDTHKLYSRGITNYKKHFEGNM